MKELKNGEVWRHPCGLYARTQWIDGDRWGLLSLPGRAAHGGTCSMFHSNKHGQMIFTEGELRAILERDEWVLLQRQPLYYEEWQPLRAEVDRIRQKSQ